MPPRSIFDGFRRAGEHRLEVAALNATAKAAQRAKRDIRNAMSAAGLGRLGNAIDAGSDAEKRGTVFRQGPSWSASGYVFVRSGSPRSRGAIEAYTEGAEIAPRKGRWLWIAQPDIPQRAGRNKMTPALYIARGFEAKIGKLQFIRAKNGTALLIVRDATVSASGKAGSARGRTKTGRVRKGQVAQDFIVAFVGIPRTSRRARVDVRAIIRSAQQELPQLIAAELGRG